MIEGTRSLEGTGYYGITNDGAIRSTALVPKNKLFGIKTQIITLAKFEELFLKACEEVIQSFSKTPANQDVYTFCIDADEHGNLAIYMNSEGELLKTQKKYIDKYQYNNDKIKELRFSLGDFSFSFFNFAKEFDEMLMLYKKIKISIEHNGSVKQSNGDEKFSVLFDKSIFDNCMPLIVLKTIRLLEPSLNKLNKAPNFVYFAGSGNGYIDYSLLMQKTIDHELFYNLFPEQEERDIRFEQIKQNVKKEMSTSDQLDYWFEEIKTKDILNSTCRPDYFAYQACYELGKNIIPVIIEKLKLTLAHGDLSENNGYEHVSFLITLLDFFESIEEDMNREFKLLAAQFNNIPLTNDYYEYTHPAVNDSFKKLVNKFTKD